MADAFKNRRRNYFIKKRFQADFIIKFCSLVIMGSLISGLIIYLMSRSAVTTTFENTRLVMKSASDFILPAVFLSSAVVIVCVGLAAILITLFTSHRIAGPLYRMEKDVGSVAAGDLTIRFGLRKMDEIKALAEGLDRMTQALRNQVVRVKEAGLSLEAALESSAGGDNREALKEAAKRLQEMKAVLSKIKT